jgi:RNA 3'-terminal phosphate cyclase (ATP)
VAQAAVDAAKHYLSAGVPVGVHLADQLLLPLAVAGAGTFVTMPPSRHTLTNIEVIQRFLPLTVECRPTEGSGAWRIGVRQGSRDA